MQGKGDPPLLVHPGLLSTLEAFESLMAPLIAKRRVIAYDHIGAGGSERPTPDERSYAVERQLADAFELAEHLGLGKRVAVGWARGSATAARHATAKPDAVEAVVMMGPPLVLETWDQLPAGVASAFRELATKGGKLAPRAFIDTGLPDATEEQKEVALQLLGGSTSSDVLAAQIDSDFGALTLEEARAVPCPTLIVWGTGDILVPPEQAHALAEAIPDSTLVEVDGAGNGVWFTRPDETFGAILEFL